MNCTETQSALSDLVDGSLPRDARTRCEAHIATCGDCRAMLADLRRIRESARALPKLSPPTVLWEKVAAGFDAETRQAKGRRLDRAATAPDPDPAVLRFLPRRRSVLTGLALAAALVLATSAGVYYMTRPAAPVSHAEPASAHVQPADTVQSIEAELELADQHAQNAIAGMEKLAKDGQSVLDPKTADVLQKNFGILDQAITESRAALRTQPTSEVARASLFEALQRKVSLLRDTIALINEMRKGDQAGTARAVGNLGKS